MKSIAILLAGLQLVSAVAIPAEASIESTDSAGAELSGLWDTKYADKPPGKSVQEQGVPAGVYLEDYIDKKKSVTPGM